MTKGHDEMPGHGPECEVTVVRVGAGRTRTFHDARDAHRYAIGAQIDSVNPDASAHGAEVSINGDRLSLDIVIEEVA